jgi:hypothetical protein
VDIAACRSRIGAISSGWTAVAPKTNDFIGRVKPKVMH